MQTRHSEVEAWSSLNTVTQFDAGSTVVVGTQESDLALQEFKPSSPVSLLVQSLVEQLCRLMAKNPKHQKRLYHVICDKLHEMNLIDQSYSIEEYEFIRNSYQKSLVKLVSVAKSVIVGSNDNSLVQLPRLTLEKCELAVSSRYRTDYEEVEYIAKGGFGHVYRVRHILDGMEYAVKKICIQCQNISSFLQNLREVKMLARLHHPNIVAYKAAWVEPVTSVPEMTSVEMDREHLTNCVALQNYQDVTSKKYEPPSSSDDSASIVFEDPSHSEDNGKGACGGISQSDTSTSFSEESDLSIDKVVCKYQSMNVTVWNNSWTGPVAQSTCFEMSSRDFPGDSTYIWLP
ncbi:hypothetical protein L9F63_005186, partial [Diploptera punctata]